MRDKIFNEILKTYPSCHDLNHKWKLADKILNLPVDGVQVKKLESIGNDNSDKEKTINYRRYVNHPLTIGEALKMLPNMVYLLSEKINDPLYRDALTTKDGGIVELKGE